jgi:hypothetical protein
MYLCFLGGQMNPVLPLLLEQFYQGLQDEDTQQLPSLFSSDAHVFFNGPKELLFSGSYHGRDRVSTFVSRFLTSLEVRTINTHHLIKNNKQVVVIGEMSIISKRSQLEAVSNFSHAFVLSSDIQLVMMYHDTHQLISTLSNSDVFGATFGAVY